MLGADTVVVLDGDILGKPADEDAARAYLRRLNGRTHEVVGAIVLAEAGEVVATAVETTRVTFHRRSDDEIDAYVATGEWVGRAGGYAIQETGGTVLVERVDGDYLNVVGLPLASARTAPRRGLNAAYSHSQARASALNTGLHAIWGAEPFDTLDPRRRHARVPPRALPHGLLLVPHRFRWP